MDNNSRLRVGTESLENTRDAMDSSRLTTWRFNFAKVGKQGLKTLDLIMNAGRSET